MIGLPAPLPAPAPVEAQSAMAVINDRLKGRMKYATVLGILLGATLSVAGIRFAPVKYAANGNIHVASTGTAILRETSDTAYMPRYEGTRRTHEILVSSPRVIEMAMQDQDLLAIGLIMQPDAFRKIKKGLKTTTEYNTELISVTFEADSPEVSVKVLNAVLRAYYAIHGSRGGSEFRNRRLIVLQENRASKRQERGLKRRELSDIIANSEYGVKNLEPILQAQLLRIENLKQSIEQIELALSEMHEPEPVAEDDAVAAADREPIQAELEILDPDLALLYRARQDLELDIRRLSRKYSSSHQQVRKALDDLDMLEERIEVREQSARERWYALGGAMPVVTPDTDLLSLTPEQMRERFSTLQGLLKRNQEEVKTLNDEQIRIQDLELDLEEIDLRLAEFDQAIDLIQIESDAQFAGRVSITEGMLPRYPAKDRRKAMAMIGFVGGLGLSFVLFFLLGTIDQRTYSAQQLLQHATSYRCLGVLPFLGAKSTDAELSETAAQCVHQIRNRIEAFRAPSASHMLVVTSPYQGDGKTSLAMALGWSYAAAGHRTLLVDCDLLGRSLTHQMQLGDRPGVKEVLRDRNLDAQVVDLPVPNLSVLGAGLDSSFGPESIRRDDFASLCGELRHRYDIVIADTGPFIGSVELLPVAAASDGVIFSVRRGRSRNRLEECLGDLGTINVPCLGVVLNCADRADCNRYVSKSTISMRHHHESDAGQNGNGAVQPRHVHNALIKAMEHASGKRSDN